MNNLLRLLKVNLLHTFNINAIFHEESPKERLKLAGFLAIMLLVGVVACSYSYFYFSMLAPSYMAMGMIDMLLGTMMAICSFLILFTSVYKVVGLVIGCKDYDMLASLPIKNQDIMISKWATLYLGNLLFLLVILVPGVIVYQSYVHVDVMFYILLALLIMVLPLLPLTIGCLVGIVIRFLASRFKYSNILTVVLSCGAIILYMYFIFQLQSKTELVSIGTTVATMLNNMYPLTTIFVDALCNLDIVALVLFTIINVASFGIFTALLSKYYVRINNALLERKAKGNYVLTKAKRSGVLMTLFKKEMKRYFSSSIYVLNTAMGVLLQTVAIVYLAFQGEATIREVIPMDISGLLVQVLPIFVCLLAGMCTTTACCISMEGKQLWIIKTLPISTMQIFLAKMLVNVVITLPLSIMNTLIISFVFHLPIVQVFLALLIIIVYVLCSSMSGLIINLFFPVFNWQSEARVVKQSISVMLQMVFGIALAIVPGVMLLVYGLPFVLEGYLIFLVILTSVEYLFLKNQGSKIFYQL